MAPPPANLMGGGLGGFIGGMIVNAVAGAAGVATGGKVGGQTPMLSSNEGFDLNRPLCLM